MNLIKTALRVFIIANILLLVFSFYKKVDASSPTFINSDVTENSTWIKANSPYVVENDISVWPGVTLGIEPGVVVKIQPDAKIDVFGSFVAEGTVDEHIFFTSYWDDTIGGDTNMNNEETIPSSDLENSQGLWRGIYFNYAENISLDNCDTSFSVNSFYFIATDASISNLKSRNNHHDLNIWEYSNVSLAGGDFYGSTFESIYLVDSTLIGDHITVDSTKNWEGYITFNSNLSLTDSLIKDVEGEAIASRGPGTINLTRVNMENNFGGIVGYSQIVFNIQDSVLDNTGIITWDNSIFNLNNTTIQNSTLGIQDFDGDTLNIVNSKIINNIVGIYLYTDPHLREPVYNISNSSIYNNTQYGVYNDTPFKLNFINTFWGDASGPENPTSNPTGLGNSVSDNVLFNPWCKNESCAPVLSGGSNVLFLPGIMSSRLYEEDVRLICDDPANLDSCIYDKELWVSKSDSNHARLNLDDGGKSINKIYTKNDTKKLDSDGDETGIVDDFYNFNIYQSFLSDLKDWKEEGTIADYDFIPYDWRLSLEDIITNGATEEDGKLSYTNSQDFSQSFILKKLQELQASSKSGKVTLIGHSNGGLVIKAFIQKLKDTDNPLYNEIDKVIFVGVPQVGTPDAIPAILHGSPLFHGIVMNQDRHRWLAENMPSVYNLLPSSAYFTTVDPSFAIDKVVSFADDPLFTSQISQYGYYISDQTELFNYILGNDGRLKPSYSDVQHPNIGNSTLYSQALNAHKVLGNWQPAPSTKVIQVAGWGEETLAGLDYEAYLSYPPSKGKYISHKPRSVIDGDGTVVVPSALWMPENENVERWWVDLDLYDTIGNIERVHRDILEIQNLRDFIKFKIEDPNNENSQKFEDPDSIVINNPSNLISDNTRRLHYTLHSPLTLGITDSEGRYTGIDPVTKETQEEIPNVTYRQIGEVQFISVPTGESYTLKLHGYEPGFFSLDVDEQTGNDVTASTSFQGIASTASTNVTMDIIPTSDVSNTNLKIDQNGDGNIDFNLAPKVGEVVTLPSYIFSGFNSPINNPANKGNIFKAGSTVPVKFQLKKLDGSPTQASSAPIWLAPQKGSSTNFPENQSRFNATIINESTYKWDATSQQYLYNWSTKGLASGYWYKIFAKLDDGSIHSVIIGLK